MMSVDPPRRSRLLSLLSEACELEHSLSAAYLYAAFSLKRGQLEGLGWRSEQQVARWAAQLFFVASQEMLHLAQAWNLLAAVGGTPYYYHAPFPVSRATTHIARLSLEGFSLPTMRRFARWEQPDTLRLGRLPLEEEGPPTTVGELYNRIEELVRALPEQELFIGIPDNQIGPHLADFPQIIQVVDRPSALTAIALIRAQGEGSPADREDCHYGVFVDILHELEAEIAATPTYQPALQVVANPSRSSYPGATVVTDPIAVEAMGIFDDLYGLMLRMLAWVFGVAGTVRQPALAAGASGRSQTGRVADPQTRAFARMAIGVMPVLIKPLGQALMRLPSGLSGLGAGPSFSIGRHIPLPDDPALALLLVRERGTDLVQDLLRLATQAENIAPIESQTFRSAAKRLGGFLAALEIK